MILGALLKPRVYEKPDVSTQFAPHPCYRRTSARSRPINVTCDELTAAVHSA
jgi:hypothetical protein